MRHNDRNLKLGFYRAELAPDGATNVVAAKLGRRVGVIEARADGQSYTATSRLPSSGEVVGLGEYANMTTAFAAIVGTQGEIDF